MSITPGVNVRGIFINDYAHVGLLVMWSRGHSRAPEEPNVYS
jgi:hypothetical protein